MKKNYQIKKKEMDVYLASDLLHKCLSDYCDDNIEAEEMYIDRIAPGLGLKGLVTYEAGPYWKH
jgi:hypothetical protein